MSTQCGPGAPAGTAEAGIGYGAHQERARWRRISTGTLATAIEYRRRGWSVVPIPAGSKIPCVAAWQSREFDFADFADGGNLAVILGPRSGDLVDIDLDCTEAIGLAGLFLPVTGAVFGRASKPHSHRLFVSAGAVKESFADPLSGDMLLELRAAGHGGGAHLTVLPPSITDGEPRTWCGDVVAPRLIDPGTLRRSAAWLAIACLVARHVSPYAAERPNIDLVDLLDEFDILEGHGGKLSRTARHWLKTPEPDALTRQPHVRLKPKHQNSGDPDLIELADAIPNDASWGKWNTTGLAFYAASDGGNDGYAAFERWSRKSPKYNPRAVIQRWNNYRRSPPSRIGMGSLLHLARQHGWAPSVARR